MTILSQVREICESGKQRPPFAGYVVAEQLSALGGIVGYEQPRKRKRSAIVDASAD